MAKKNPDFTYSIDDFMGAVKESPSHDWCKAILRITWGDNPQTIDIRNVNMSKNNQRIGKGVSLSNEEADRVVSILLDNGFGSLEDVERALKERRHIFTVDDDGSDNSVTVTFGE